MTVESPSAEVLAERIKALDRRIDERFLARDEALKLAVGSHRASVAMWLSVGALLVALATVGVMMVRHV